MPRLQCRRNTSRAERASARSARAPPRRDRAAVFGCIDPRPQLFAIAAARWDTLPEFFALRNETRPHAPLRSWLAPLVGLRALGRDGVSARDSVLTAACDPSRVQRDASDEPEFIVPSMPTALRQLPEWFRDVQDAYTRAALDGDKLRECRRAVSTLCEIHRSMADVKKADAAMKSAEASEEMAKILDRHEHGGAATLLLEQLRAAMAGERRQRLPGRAVPPLAERSESA